VSYNKKVVDEMIKRRQVLEEAKKAIMLAEITFYKYTIKGY